MYDAKFAWTALNGQEVRGKWVKMEFSQQGGPVHKHDMMAIGHDAWNKGVDGKLQSNGQLPFARPDMVMLSNMF